jgi:hypothetical protein
MKRISISPENIAALVAEFKASLTNLKTNQEKIVFEKKFSELTKVNESEIKKPIIYFSMEAWIKMVQLVKKCDKEIAWQATVEKRKYKDKEDSDDFYYFIKQVYVYPQKVTGTFVDVDEAKYAEWSMQLDDEIYNSLRFQGHSHVNMGTSPSTTDLNTYQNFLDQLSKGDFYIFFILNKRLEFTLMLYDYAQDIIFETKDCFIDVLTSQGSLARWTEENMKQVTEKATTYYGSHWDFEEQSNKKWKEKPEDLPEKITYANSEYYVCNGRLVEFESTTDAAEFYLEHPEFVTASNPNKIIKQIMIALHKKEESNTQKKRGRPKKQ